MRRIRRVAGVSARCRTCCDSDRTRDVLHCAQIAIYTLLGREHRRMRTGASGPRRVVADRRARDSLAVLAGNSRHRRTSTARSRQILPLLLSDHLHDQRATLPRQLRCATSRGHLNRATQPPGHAMHELVLRLGGRELRAPNAAASGADRHRHRLLVAEPRSLVAPYTLQLLWRQASVRGIRTTRAGHHRRADRIDQHGDDQGERELLARASSRDREITTLGIRRSIDRTGVFVLDLCMLLGGLF